MAYDLITKHTSPNSSPRSYYGHSGGPTGITIHWWGSKGQRFENVVSWLCNPAAGTSAHYVVEAGRVACIVSPELAGWHSGSTIGNGATIGIECRPEATDGDYETVAELIRDLRATYGNLPLYPHNQWAATACPGDYDLDRLDRLARNARITKPAAASAPKPIQEDDMPSAKEVAEESWDVEIGLGKQKYQTGSYLLWTHNNTGRILDRLNAQNAQIEGLAGAVVALSKGEKLDIDKLLAGVEAAAKRGVESGIESITHTETTTAKVK